MSLDSADEGSSKLDMPFFWRGLGSMMEEACFLRIFFCSVVVLSVNDPPMVMSRYRVASMSGPEQKRCNSMLSSKHKSRPACINVENLV